MTEKRGIKKEGLKEQIQQCIIAGLNSPKSIQRKQWEAFPHDGGLLTPKEYVRYAAEKFTNEESKLYCRSIRKSLSLYEITKFINIFVSLADFEKIVVSIGERTSKRR